jgi:hypothetical protein
MRIGAESGSGFVCFEADERPRISAIGVLSDTSTFVLRFLGWICVRNSSFGPADIVLEHFSSLCGFCAPAGFTAAERVTLCSW